MRFTRILYIGFVAANLAGLRERISHLADSAAGSMHSHFRCFEKCYEQIKNTAIEKLHITCGRTRELVRKNEIFKPRSLEEFKEMINRLVKKGRANILKEKSVVSSEQKKDEIKNDESKKDEREEL